MGGNGVAIGGELREIEALEEEIRVGTCKRRVCTVHRRWILMKMSSDEYRFDRTMSSVI